MALSLYMKVQGKQDKTLLVVGKNMEQYMK